MSQQHPQPQPNQPHPQQPGWGGPQTPPGYGHPPFQPLPPKKSNTGKIIGFGCLGVVALLVVIGAIGVAVGGSSSNESSGSSDVTPAASAPKDDRNAAAGEPSDKAKTGEAKDDEAKVVTFKVWGTAPAGALGPLDITYGSDSDTRKGTFKNGKFEATLPLGDDALFYNVMAQLQGSGDIQCSVTVDGHTEKAHASGGYNICHAQANAGLLGWD
ncbi:hypothetical protein [Streptomyces sp. NPDC014995]|uniref:hypothetical protein n=1 Tax=Streptomyces sp. NPDC014995 TaxID=3364936 RepID=UPI0036FFF4E6